MSVPPQLHKQGDEVIPGAIIHFDKVPIKYISSRALEVWLTCRGVPTPSLDNCKELEEMVNIARLYEVDALPKFVMRSGGGCVTASVMAIDISNWICCPTQSYSPFHSRVHHHSEAWEQK